MDALVEAFSELVTCVMVDMEGNGNGKITGARTYKLIIYLIRCGRT